MDSSGKEQEEGIVSPREWFNRNAKSYDDALSSTLALAENEVLFNWVGQSINSQTTVFDAGCGTGLLLDYIDIPPENYVGWDISEEMVSIAQCKHPHHKFVCRDITASSEEKYDVVVGVVSIMKNIRLGVEACFNKTKEEGTTILMPNGTRDPYSRDDSIYTLLNTNKIRVHNLTYTDWEELLKQCGVSKKLELDLEKNYMRRWLEFRPFNIKADSFSNRNISQQVFQYILELEMQKTDWENSDVGFYLMRIYA